MQDPETWPGEVDGAKLLTALETTFGRYVVMPDHAPLIVALWVLQSHALDAFRIAPLLAFVSAVRGSGKTTALELLAALLPRALFASNITPAVLFRVIERYRPSLLIDEADRIFRGPSDELRTLVNASHLKKSAFVMRCHGDDFEPRAYSTWAPKALALIGDLPPTLHDRAIVVRMRKRLPEERIKSYKLDSLDAELEPLKRQAACWVADNLSSLQSADPVMPNTLRDRAADNARPLLAIADLAGGAWPERARVALAANLDRSEGDETECRINLLADLREISRGRDIRTRDTLIALNEREDRPWGEWGRRDKPLTAHGLGRLLRPFGLSSRTIRFGDSTAKGYLAKELEDVFARYLSPKAKHGNNPQKSATSRKKQSGTTLEDVTLFDPREPAEVSNCDRVTVQTTEEQTMLADLNAEIERSTTQEALQ